MVSQDLLLAWLLTSMANTNDVDLASNGNFVLLLLLLLSDNCNNCNNCSNSCNRCNSCNNCNSCGCF